MTDRRRCESSPGREYPFSLEERCSATGADLRLAGSHTCLSLLALIPLASAIR
jgi:hypothetical protein